MREVWPDIFVDDGNLRFQMATLRKALGDDRDLIKTRDRPGLSADRRDPISSRRPAAAPAVAPRPVQLFRIDAPAGDGNRRPCRLRRIPRTLTIFRNSGHGVTNRPARAYHPGRRDGSVDQPIRLARATGTTKEHGGWAQH